MWITIALFTFSLLIMALVRCCHAVTKYNPRDCMLLHYNSLLGKFYVFHKLIHCSHYCHNNRLVAVKTQWIVSPSKFEYTYWYMIQNVYRVTFDNLNVAWMWSQKCIITLEIYLFAKCGLQICTMKQKKKVTYSHVSYQHIHQDISYGNHNW